MSALRRVAARLALTVAPRRLNPPKFSLAAAAEPDTTARRSAMATTLTQSRPGVERTVSAALYNAETTRRRST